MARVFPPLRSLLLNPLITDLLITFSCHSLIAFLNIGRKQIDRDR
jgi:hypothetical protein